MDRGVVTGNYTNLRECIPCSRPRSGLSDKSILPPRTLAFLPAANLTWLGCLSFPLVPCNDPLGLNGSAQQVKTTLYANLHHLHAKRTFPIVVETASGGDICGIASEGAGADECWLAQ